MPDLKQVGDTGFITSIRENIVEINFPGVKPGRHELLTLEGDRKVKLEVYTSGRDNTVYAIVLSDIKNLYRGAKVIRTGEVITVPVGSIIKGRLINVFGEPQDGMELRDSERRPIYKNAPTYAEMSVPTEILQTGVKAVDFFTPIKRGGKVGVFGGSGVGKTVLLLELIHNVEFLKNTTVIFAGIGERIREGHELYESLQQQNLLKDTALVFGEINERAANRFRVAYSAATIAEYFRDEAKQDVVFFVDNIYRFIQAGNELSTLLGSIPSEDWYQPTLASDIGMFEERLISTKNGAITSIQAIYVPADDLADAGVQAVFTYFDSVIVLSRSVAGEGRYPAVDILSSSSSVIDPEIIGKDHYDIYLEAVSTLKRFSQLNRIVSIVGEYELTRKDQILYHRARKLQNYMTQNLFVTGEQTGRKGSFVPRTKTIKDVKDIITGLYDEYDEELFLFVGDLADVKKKGVAGGPSTSSGSSTQSTLRSNSGQASSGQGPKPNAGTAQTAGAEPAVAAGAAGTAVPAVVPAAEPTVS